MRREPLRVSGAFTLRVRGDFRVAQFLGPAAPPALLLGLAVVSLRWIDRVIDLLGLPANAEWWREHVGPLAPWSSWNAFQAITLVVGIVIIAWSLLSKGISRPSLLIYPEDSFGNSTGCIIVKNAGAPAKITAEFSVIREDVRAIHMGKRFKGY